MKTLILCLSLFLGLKANAQFFKDWKDIYGYVGWESTLGIEFGKAPSDEYYRPVGYFLGAAGEFEDNGDFNLSVYAKGQVYMIKYVHAVVMLGTENLRYVQFGMGARGIIPFKEVTAFVEPIWITTGTKVNLGVCFKLK